MEWFSVKDKAPEIDFGKKILFIDKDFKLHLGSYNSLGQKFRSDVTILELNPIDSEYETYILSSPWISKDDVLLWSLINLPNDNREKLMEWFFVKDKAPEIDYFDDKILFIDKDFELHVGSYKNFEEPEGSSNGLGRKFRSDIKRFELNPMDPEYETYILSSIWINESDVLLWSLIDIPNGYHEKAMDDND